MSIDRKIFILNGPPNCGKTAFEEWYYDEAVVPNTTRWRITSFKGHLYDMIISMFPIKELEWWEIYNDKSTKELPHPKLLVTVEALLKLKDKFPDIDLEYKPTEGGEMYSISPRLACIFVSEVVVKPLLGEEFFSRQLIESNKAYGLLIEIGGGFVEEIRPLVKEFGEDNVHIVRIYREGCNFDNDSRDYLPLSMANEPWPKYNVDIYNTGTEEEFFNNVYSSIKALAGS